MRWVVGVVLALAALGPALAEPVPQLSWGACPEAPKGRASTAGFACATATVPIDHSDPAGGVFHLAVIKAPARQPEARIGTLFWNPGGPGDAGTQYLPAAIGGFPERVRDRFDIVSWDPRGMGGASRPVIQCFDTAAEEGAFLDAHFSSLATTPEALAADGAARIDLASRCAAKAGALLAHVSTADNARDLDLLRQAVGDERLFYYGTSYGTFLGATYASLFPERLAAAVFDGAVAPSAWSGSGGNLSTFIRLGSDFGAATTIDAFMDACGAVDASACPFSAGSPAATRAKWAALKARARSGLALDGEVVDEGALASYVASSIYLVEPLPGFGRFPGWKAVAATLEEMASAPPAPAAGSVSGAAAPQPVAAAGAPEVYTTSVGRQLAVICGESPNPATADDAAQQALASFRRAGVSPWPFVAGCAGWRVRAADIYRGPWDRARDRPVLVIGNSFDPATALPSSVRMTQDLGNATLLVVNGYGHTALLNPSRCASDYVADYLIDGRLPSLGATCAQDRPPFTGD